MCKGPTADNAEKKTSLFNKLKLTKGNAQNPKPKKEKKAKKEKKPKKATPKPAEPKKDGSVSSGLGLFQKEKKKPRAEYQEEIDALSEQLTRAQNDLASTKQQLSQSQSKFNELRRWARNPPVM